MEDHPENDPKSMRDIPIAILERRQDHRSQFPARRSATTLLAQAQASSFGGDRVGASSNRGSALQLPAGRVQLFWLARYPTLCGPSTKVPHNEKEKAHLPWKVTLLVIFTSKWRSFFMVSSVTLTVQ
jgi:hypothetical protein